MKHALWEPGLEELVLVSKITLWSFSYHTLPELCPDSFPELASHSCSVSIQGTCCLMGLFFLLPLFSPLLPSFFFSHQYNSRVKTLCITFYSTVGPLHLQIQLTLEENSMYFLPSLGICGWECENTVSDLWLIESADWKPWIGRADGIYWKRSVYKGICAVPTCVVLGVNCIDRLLFFVILGDLYAPGFSRIVEVTTEPYIWQQVLALLAFCHWKDV